MKGTPLWLPHIWGSGGPAGSGGRRGASQCTSGSCLRDFGGDFFLWPGDTPWAAAASRAAFLGDLWGLQDVSELQRQRGRAGCARAAGGASSLRWEPYPEPRDLARLLPRLLAGRSCCRRQLGPGDAWGSGEGVQRGVSFQSRGRGSASCLL